MKERGIITDEQSGDLAISVRRDATGKITSGLVIDDVTKQNQVHILTFHAGELKEHPTVGVGLSSLLLSHDNLLAKHKIREQLEADGQNVSYLNIKTTVDNKTEIQINANYK